MFQNYLQERRHPQSQMDANISQMINLNAWNIQQPIHPVHSYSMPQDLDWEKNQQMNLQGNNNTSINFGEPQIRQMNLNKQNYSNYNSFQQSSHLVYDIPSSKMVENRNMNNSSYINNNPLNNYINYNNYNWINAFQGQTPQYSQQQKNVNISNNNLDLEIQKANQYFLEEHLKKDQTYVSNPFYEKTGSQYNELIISKNSTPELDQYKLFKNQNLTINHVDKQIQNIQKGYSLKFLDIYSNESYEEALSLAMVSPTQVLTFLPYMIPKTSILPIDTTIEYQSIPDFPTLSIIKILDEIKKSSIQNSSSISEIIEPIKTTKISITSNKQREYKLFPNTLNTKEIKQSNNNFQKQKLLPPHSNNALKVPVLLYQSQRKALLPSQRIELSTWIQSTTISIHEIISVNQFMKIIEKNSELTVVICQKLFEQSTIRNSNSYFNEDKDGDIIISNNISNLNICKDTVMSENSQSEYLLNNESKLNTVSTSTNKNEKSEISNENYSQTSKEQYNSVYYQYLTALVYLPVSFHTLEVVNQLVAKSCFPRQFLFLFIENAIKCCESESNPKEISRNRTAYAQQRLVRLLCMFLKSLLIKNIILASEVAYMVKPFCIPFLTHQGARELYELVNIT